MYVDFQIDDSGDLLFTEKNNNKPQKVSFNLTHTRTQKIAINLFDCETINHKNNNYLKVEFFIDNDKPKNIANIVTGDDSLAQLITLKLKTTLGTLPERLTFGSKLSTFKHQNLDDSSLKNLRVYLTSILENDIPNVNVDVQPFIDYNNGYKQTVNIAVYNSNKLLLEYKVER